MNFDNLDNPAAARIELMKVNMASADSSRWKEKRTKKPKAETSGAIPRADLNEQTRKWIRMKEFEHFRRVDFFDSALKRQHDFWEMFDYHVLNPDQKETTCFNIAIQVTSISNMSARRHKILTSPHFEAFKACGWGILVLGFAKGPNGRYYSKEVWL